MTDNPLIIAAADLARTSPQEWAKFLAAFEAYSGSRATECISSTPDMLQVTQGRAQACVALRKLFAECVQTTERIAKAEAQRTQQPRSPQKYAAPAAKWSI